MEAYVGSVRKNTAALLCPCLEHRDIDLFQKSSSEYEFSRNFSTKQHAIQLVANPCFLEKWTTVTTK